MGRRAGLLAGVLVLALGSGVVAQSPSPEPPPWFGGRVEMPEHGFAVTIPEDWVAFDTSIGALGQLQSAGDFLDPAVWTADDDGFFANSAAQGVQLVIVDAGSVNWCGVGVLQGAFPSLDELAVFIHGGYADNPAYHDVQAPQPIALRAGPAYLITSSLQPRPVVDAPVLSSHYLLGMDGGVLMAVCNTPDADAAGDWLAIVETIEFLSEAE